MKLYFISLMESTKWGGSEELWSNSALHALESGNDVFCSIKKWPQVADKIQLLKNKGATIYERKGNDVNKRLSWYFKKIFKLRLISLKQNDDWIQLREGKIDKVCVSFGGSYDIIHRTDLITVLQKTKTPYSVILQLNHENYPISTNIRHTVRDFFLNAENLFFVSERNKKTFERNLVTKLKNGVVINNPVKISKRGYREFTNPEIWQMACVARFDCRYKNQDILFELISRDHWKRESFQINLYGSGSDEFYLNELISFYGIEDKVTIHGQVSDIDTVWEKNHILIMPSFAEGTPLALIEAMYSGRTAVVTDVGGNSFLIEDNETGFLAESYQLESFDKALKRAWEKRLYWNEMGKKAYDRINSVYLTEPHKNLYQQLTINTDLATNLL